MPPRKSSAAVPGTLKPINSARVLADARTIGKDNYYKIDPRLLEEEPGLSPRDYDSPESRAKIRMFADAYKAGRYVPAIEFRVENGRMFVIEGHHRRRGALLAIEEGTEVPFLRGH